MEKKIQHIIANMNALIRAETLDGRDYLVAPVILITEGVHNNLYYPAAELKKFPKAWNGSPLPLQHPTVNGSPISANSPDILRDMSIGQVFNVNFEAASGDAPARLKGEAWMDKARIQALADAGNEEAKALQEKLNANEPIEISTGLFAEDEMTPGEFNGNSYEAIARNHRPDHLAILATGVGACSVADGCGLPRVNAESGAGVNPLMKIGMALMDLATGKAGQPIHANELTHHDQHMALEEALKQKLQLKMRQHIFIVDVGVGWVVYNFHDHDTGKSVLYRRTFVINGQDQITVGDVDVPVSRRTEFINQPMQTTSNPTTNEWVEIKENDDVTNNGEKLAALLNRTIDSMVTDSRSRGDIIRSMASAARISESTVGQILNGSITRPPLNRLRGFSRALKVPVARLIAAAEADGGAFKDNGRKLGIMLKGLVDKAVTDTRSRGDVLDAMASAAGISRATLSEIMSGEINKPPLRRLRGFARVLGVSVQRLVRTAANDTSTVKNPTHNRESTMNEKVDTLIANESNQFTEADREFLLKLNEEQLYALAVPSDENAGDCGCGNTPCSCEGVSTNTKTETPAPAKKEEPTVNDDDKVMTKGDMKALMAECLTEVAAEQRESLAREPIVNRLKANELCQLEEADLNAMSVNALEKLEQSINPGFYDGKGTVRDGTAVQVNEIEEMPPLFVVGEESVSA